MDLTNTKLKFLCRRGVTFASPESTPREVSKSVSFRLEENGTVESIPLQQLSSAPIATMDQSTTPTPPSGSQSAPSPPETPPPIPPPRSIDQVTFLAKVRGSCEVSL